MSVPSQGQYVLHSVPLTLRKPISPQDQSRPRPLAQPALPGPPRRSMSASTTRPARHSIPLSLSIVARPHGAGLIYPGELIPLPLSGSIPELPHVAKVENRTALKISRKLIFRPLCCCVAFQRHCAGS